MQPMDDDQLDALLASLQPQHAPPPAPVAAGLDRAIARAERLRRRRRRRLALPLIPLVAGAATAGALALRPSSAVDEASLQVSCAADLTLNRTFTQPAQTPDPVADCARAWAAGQVVPEQRRVPPLEACVVSGEIRVYPAANACGVLALPAFAGYSTSQLAAFTLNRVLQTYDRLGPVCRSARDVSAFVQVQLEQLKLKDWKILVRSDPACRGIVVSLSMKTVLIG